MYETQETPEMQGVRAEYNAPRTLHLPNCQILFEMGIVPNIKQGSSSVNRGKPYRSRAAKVFDEEGYHQRVMIEGIFGEEPKLHQLYCRLIIPDNRTDSARSGPSYGISRC